jgi:hypothetical protein
MVRPSDAPYELKGLPAAAAGAKSVLDAGLGALGSFVSGCETMISPIFIYKPFKLYKKEKS